MGLEITVVQVRMLSRRYQEVRMKVLDEDIKLWSDKEEEGVMEM